MTIEKRTTDLTTLADKVNAEHRACEEAVGAALGHAINAGELLTEAKEGVPHGSWGAWLADNFEGSERTAQAYMKVYRRRDEIRNGAADLSLRGALKELSAPRAVRVLGDWMDCRDFDELNEKADAVARGEARGDGEWSANAWHRLSGEDLRARAGWFREQVIWNRITACIREDEQEFEHWRGQLLMLERIVRPIDIPVSRERFGLLDRLSGTQCLKTIAQLDNEGVFPLEAVRQEGAT